MTSGIYLKKHTQPRSRKRYHRVGKENLFFMKKLCNCKLLLLLIISLISLNSYGQGAITVQATNAIAPETPTGSILLTGAFDVGTSYQVVYHLTGKSGNDTVSLPATDAGITISGLKAGVYSHLMVINDGTVSRIKGHVIIRDNIHVLATWVDPTCDGMNGEIEIPVSINDSAYIISYYLDGEKNWSTYDESGNADINERNVAYSHNGFVAFKHLPVGTYTRIEIRSVVKYTDSKNKNTTARLGNPIKVFSVVLKSNKKDCIAVQKTEFMGAVYQNFTGIQDDDPADFTQTYARLTQPLNKGQGIAKNAKTGKRFIPLRNFLFQITYANTDNFKMYTTDFFATKYVNRLDLLEHSYFNGCLNLNLISYVMPEAWKINRGDMGHLYVDAFTSLITTNVIDTLKGSNPATDKTYNIKSNIFGLSGKAAFNSVFNSDFNIEVGAKLFWLFPSSKVVNGSLNPQNPDVPPSNDPMLNYVTKQDSATLNSFIVKEKNVHPYYTFEALVQYNTSKVAGNGSNIFLHYQYTSNYAGNKNGNYQNNYWQFQLGYALDINTIFPSKTATKATDTTGKDDLAPTDSIADTSQKSVTSPAAVSATTVTPQPATTVNPTPEVQPVVTVNAAPVAQPVASVTPAPPTKTKRVNDTLVKSIVTAIWDSIKIERERAKVTVVDSLGPLIVNSDRYVRVQPLVNAKAVDFIKKGTNVAFTGYTDDGEDQNGIKRWYKNNKGWFWAGEAKAAKSTKKKVTKETAAKTQTAKAAAKKK